MARILGDAAHDLPGRHPPAVHGLVVRGERFVNSAAKFWPSLVDELAADYPACDTILLELLTDAPLERELLFPAHALQRGLDQGRTVADLGVALREALAELAIIGPPGTVCARLRAGARELAVCALPLDCVDADIFPCLLVWLLEWAEIPQGLWNTSEVGGAFSARDRERKINYRLDFVLRSEHVSEGLYRRTLTLRFDRRVLAQGGAGRAPAGGSRPPSRIRHSEGG